MSQPLMIGVLTPSSNTVLEPVTTAMMADIEGGSAHFGRFRVTTISSEADSRAQFDLSAQLAAADLLADARVASIVWSGTAASWLGFDTDVEMCRQITERTGIPAHSSVLAMNSVFKALGVRRMGLISPYVDDIQEKIIGNYAAAGIDCVAERHLHETVNYAFAEFSEDRIAGLIREVAAARPDVIAIMCTNMRGARIAPKLEAELGIPVVDSTAAAVWGGLQAAGADGRTLSHWGRMFDVPTLSPAPQRDPVTHPSRPRL